VVTCYTRWDLLLIPLWHWHVPLLALAVALGCAAHIAGDELTHVIPSTLSNPSPTAMPSAPPSSARETR
jgi:hypothetical protein